MKVESLSRARLLVTPWTAAYQAPPSVGFSRQEFWSGLPLPSPEWVAIAFSGFLVLAIVNSAAMNNGIRVSFSILGSSGYMPRSEIAGSYGGFIPSFFKESACHLP